MATWEDLSGDKEIALPCLHFLAVAEGGKASLDVKYDAKSQCLEPVDSLLVAQN